MAGPKIAFHIGPISVAWYGIIIVLATLVAGYVAQVEAKRRGDDPERVWDAFLWCLVFGIVGARLYHVISSWHYYVQNPLQIFDTRAGGLGIIGAVAGGALGLWIYTRRAKIGFLHWADFAAPGLLLAQAIGRWGNFLNQELYGFPTTLPWGIKIDAAHRLPQFQDLTQYPVATTRFHPTFLYESLLNVLGFGILMYLGRRLSNWLRDGDMILIYAMYYGLVRFVVEFQRPDAWTIGPLATAQWISLAAIAVGGALLALRHRKGLQPAEVERKAA